MKSLLLILMSVGFCTSTLANENALSGNTNIASCWKTQLEAPIGTRCAYNAFEFVRIQDEYGAVGWKDQSQGGKIWFFHDLKELGYQTEAIEYCKSKTGQKLPSNEDFSLAESHGFRNIFKAKPSDHKDTTYWSSSSHPIYPDNFACVFHRNESGPGYTYCRTMKSIKWEHTYALCISEN